MKKTHPIGYAYYENYGEPTDKLTIRLLEEKGASVTPIIFEEQMDFDSLREKTQNCKLVMNNAVYEPITMEGIELTKTLEELGIKVINSSHSFFYQEDKWMFYLKCLEHHLPTPKTYFIPKERNHQAAYVKYLLSLGPLVLKAVYSDRGLCVSRVADYKTFCRKLKDIKEKNPTSPVIAQRFIPNNCRTYRVTLIGYKVAHALIKTGSSWKRTGVWTTEHDRTIKLPPAIIKLCERAARVFGMELCGLDIISHGKEWYIIEANSCPSFKIINKREHELAEKLADYLIATNKRLR